MGCFGSAVVAAEVTEVLEVGIDGDGFWRAAEPWGGVWHEVFPAVDAKEFLVEIW